MSNPPIQPVKSVLLIGAHDSGKSNFLMRLWLALDAGNGILTKAGLPKDLDYLKIGGDHLLKGEFAPHTSQEVYEKTEISVKSNTAVKQQFSGTLVVPDLPGEQIPRVFRSRQWSDDWEDKIQVGCSCLIFVRVDSKEITAPLDWLNCVSMFGGAIPTTAPETDDDNNPKPPTQVILVDWLQFLREAFTDRVGGSYIPRIGIVVAAWDRAPMDQKANGASAWVAANLPMLSHFIETNDDSFEFEFFGVSVTSGDLDSDPDFKDVYMNGDPRKAGEVTHSLSGNIAISDDVTLPVAWALGIIDRAIEKDA